MFGRNQMANSSPSDLQAKEKLNLFIYEYLYHIGAVKAAQGLCADMKWEPNKVTLGESPGFLFSWWCVFWDLYNATPERRDQQIHSEEAEAFHQYVKTSKTFENSTSIVEPNFPFFPVTVGPPSMIPQFPRFPTSTAVPRAMPRFPLSQHEFSNVGPIRSLNPFSNVLQSSNFNDEDSTAILKLKESMEEEVKRLHQHSTNDDLNFN